MNINFWQVLSEDLMAQGFDVVLVVDNSWNAHQLKISLVDVCADLSKQNIEQERWPQVGASVARVGDFRVVLEPQRFVTSVVQDDVAD